MIFHDVWGLLLVEATLLASILIIILFIKRSLSFIPPQKAKAFSASKKSLETTLEKITHLLKESQTLSQDLSGNLAEKKEIVKILVESLDEKIRSLNHLLEKIERKIPASTPGPGAREGNGQVLEMAMAGCDVTDIAKRLGLSKEEVQLILDLKKITIS